MNPRRIPVRSVIAILGAAAFLTMPSAAYADFVITGPAARDVSVIYTGGCYKVQNYSARRVRVKLGPALVDLQRGETKQGPCVAWYIGDNTATYLDFDPNPPPPPQTQPAQAPSRPAPPVYRAGASTARSNGAAIPATPPTLDPSIMRGATQPRTIPREVSEKLSGIWRFCSGAYSMGDNTDIGACATEQSQRICNELIASRFFNTIADCRAEMNKIPHRTG